MVKLNVNDEHDLMKYGDDEIRFNRDEMANERTRMMKTD